LARKTNAFHDEVDPNSSSSILSTEKSRFNSHLYIREHLVATEQRNSGAPILTDDNYWLMGTGINHSNDQTLPTLIRLRNDEVLKFHGIHLGADRQDQKSDYTFLSGRVLCNLSANKYLPTDSPVFLHIYLSAILDLTTTTTKHRLTNNHMALDRFYEHEDVQRIKSFIGQIRFHLSHDDKQIDGELSKMIELIDLTE
jgi:hypothetical protein